ncbi:major facilitator superfamily protein [Listeria grayi FSL F6-1183]|uniref:Major facilitator superfamily protein n=1 Tax=Listeria grayi FSL F6-1183 TaxID=1265827 RepID=A0A829R920_LISGR|nr:major facilitator superfamily protein [Listeria grayi FSL F6-1183]
MSTQSENIWTGRFIMLVLSSFTLFMSFQMLLPIVPKYAKETGGAGITIGLVAAAVSLSAIVMRFYFLKKNEPENARLALSLSSAFTYYRLCPLFPCP